MHAVAPGGRSSRTTVRVLERREDSSLCEMRIFTGRPHQIRIHLAFAGHPLVGDPLYRAGGEVDGVALPGDGGYLLHAHRLELPLPGERGWLTLRAPLPRSLWPLDRGGSPRTPE